MKLTDDLDEIRAEFAKPRKPASCHDGFCGADDCPRCGGESREQEEEDPTAWHKPPHLPEPDRIVNVCIDGDRSWVTTAILVRINSTHFWDTAVGRFGTDRITAWCEIPAVDV